jgi:hypothetical protein
MKKNETVRAVTQGQLRDIIATMITGIPELKFIDAQQIIGDKRKFASAIKEVFKDFILSDPVFRTNIFYDHSLRQMFKNLHCYWDSTKDISLKRFPFNEEGKTGERYVDVVFLHSLRGDSMVVKTRDVLEDMDKAGYRPARIEEVLPVLDSIHNLTMQESNTYKIRGNQQIAILDPFISLTESELHKHIAVIHLQKNENQLRKVELCKDTGSFIGPNLEEKMKHRIIDNVGDNYIGEIEANEKDVAIGKTITFEERKYEIVDESGEARATHEIYVDLVKE